MAITIPKAGGGGLGKVAGLAAGIATGGLSGGISSMAGGASPMGRLGSLMGLGKDLGIGGNGGGGSSPQPGGRMSLGVDTDLTGIENPMEPMGKYKRYMARV